MSSQTPNFEHMEENGNQCEYGCLQDSEHLLSLYSESKESFEEVFEKTAPASPYTRTSYRVNQTCWTLTVLNTILLGITIVLANLGSFPTSIKRYNACIQATSSYSPILSSTEIDYRSVKFNGTLWPGEEPSWSRQEPGDPEGEAKWQSYEEMPTFPITREDIIALGKDPNTSARFPDDVFGLGDEAYIASLDVQHRIHCLNELRKMAFADYGEDLPQKRGHGRLWWVHLRHCVDILTQDTFCHADADLITYQWVDTQDKPFPDFSINRQCRSLDPLIKYRDEHQVDMRKYGSMEKPKTGVITIPMEPGYYVAYGFALSELYPNGEGYEGPWPSQDGWAGYPPTLDIPSDAR